MKTARNRVRAFTLIELLLVVVILVVLASVVVRDFSRQRDFADTARAKTDISTLEGALHTFEINCGRYPTNDEGLAVLVQNPGESGWLGPYVKLVPPDPWGVPYVYKAPGEHLPDSFDLFSLGKDKTESEDDVVNWRS